VISDRADAAPTPAADHGAMTSTILPTLAAGALMLWAGLRKRKLEIKRRRRF
jgi:hypothetical protein